MADDRDLATVVRGTPEWADVRRAFLEAQNGQCAICRDPVEKPHLDHCHQTGFVRGVLCPPCNARLGWYENRRQEIEAYLAKSAAFAAHVTPQRLSRAERWRTYWQTKEID